MRYKGVTKFIAGLLAAAMVVTGVPVSTLNTADAKTKTEKLSYKGYTKVWEDNFDGNALNMKDWNVETHEPGWVNAELQEYTESGNIKVSDGKLTIIPKRTKNADGTYSYTSGRINTQNKHDFKYGIMEARMKFPKGQGYLPAFWMMPTNENLYGQWPKCGEIDIAEVMGQDTKKIYGTIHYGEPHAQSQGTEVLKKGNFADDWHTCAVEWEPGSIKWYVDGVLYHEEHSWFTKTPGQGEVTYPAPFDQNFYIIFNLAIGGSWVGYPDKTTDYNSNFQVDYVKVYQKKNYNDNVKKPEKKVVLKKADKKGNFISNADFSKNEKLDGSANWQFMTAQSGEGSAAIKNKKIEIKTKNAGKEEYSIQLVQPGLPMEKGATYEVSFDAYADKARTMKVDISGPDMNYMRYFNDTAVNLTTKKKSYKFKFTMNEDTDANSRLEFNMGAQGSTANVYITNVKVKKVKSATKAEADKKTVLADGNLVYNGKFQEGDKRLGYWNIKKKNASVAVSNKNYNDRKLVVKLTKDSKVADVKVYQTGLAFEANKEYSVSFDASATTARTIKVKVAGKTFSAKLNKATKNYEFIMKTGKKLSDKSVIFYLGGKKGTVCIDNVVVTENSLIKNGSFNAGTTGWTEWHDTSEADLSFVIDSLSEDNAADFTIKKTGSEDWKIQLKQENVPLEKDQYYKLTFKAKSSKTRKMRAIMQGLEDKNWEVYSGENTVKLTSKYKTYTKVFQMTADSDPKAQISFCLGAVAGKAINTQHRVCIDDVNLEIISEKEAKKYLGEGPKTQDSMIKDGTFVKGMEMWSEWHEAAEADAQYEVVDNAVHFTVNKTGSEDWKIQLKQENIKLEQGHYYKLTFKGKSDLERKVRATVQGGETRNYSHYTGDYFVTLKKDYQTYEHVFKMNEATDDKTSFQICMGAVGGAINKTHNMYFTDFSLVEISEEEGKKLAKNQFAGGVAGGGYYGGSGNGGGAPVTKPASVGQILSNVAMTPDLGSTGANVSAGNENGKAVVRVTDTGNAANPGDIKVPVAKITNVKPDRINVITIKASMKTGARTYGLRRARLMSGGGENYVQFAIKIGDAEPVVLKDKNGNSNIQLTNSETAYQFIYQGNGSDLVEPQIICFVGKAEADKKIEIGSVQADNTIEAADIPNNMLILENADFSNSYSRWEKSIVAPGTGSITYNDKQAIINVTNPGTADWNVQLKQMGLPLAEGGNYKVTFTAESTVARTMKASVMAVSGENYGWINGADVLLKANEPNTVTFYIRNMKATEGGVNTASASKGIFFSMGRITDAGYMAGDTPASTIKISNLSVTKVETAGEDTQTNPGTKPSGGNGGETEEVGTDEIDANKLLNANFASGVETNWFISKTEGNTVSVNSNQELEFDIKTVGDNAWDDCIAQDKINLVKDHYYMISFDISSTAARSATCALSGENGDPWYGGTDFALTAGDKMSVTAYVNMTGKETNKNATFKISLGKFTTYVESVAVKHDTATSKITISNLVVKRIKSIPGQPETPEQPGEPENPEDNPQNTETNLFRDPTLSGNSWWNDWDVQVNGGSIKENSKNNNNNALNFTVTNIGTGNDNLFVKQNNISLDAGSYDITFDIQCDHNRNIQAVFINTSDNYQWLPGCTGEESLEANTKKTIKMTLTLDGSKTGLEFRILLGKLTNPGIESNVEHSVSVSNMKMIKK